MLHKAARQGDAEELLQIIHDQKLVRRHLHFLDELDSDGLTPLHLTIIYGRIQCAEVLTKSGCSLEMTCNGVPVLHLAMTYAAFPHRRQRMMDILQCLLDSGAPLEATSAIKDNALCTLDFRDDGGCTVFHLVAGYGIVDCIMSACIQAERGMQRLTRRPSTQSFSVRDPLMQRQDAVGNTPFHVAAKMGNLEALEYLMKHCSETTCHRIIGRLNDEGNSPLHVAAMHGHSTITAMLFRLTPASWSFANAHGVTPNQLAEISGHQGFLEAMMEAVEDSLDAPNDPKKEAIRKRLPTWIVTSAEFHRHRTHPADCRPRHYPPENARRLAVLVDYNRGVLHSQRFTNLRWHLTPSLARSHDILKVHDFGYYDYIRKQCEHLPSDNSKVFNLDGDTAISHDTFRCALMAAGSICEAVDILMKGEGRNAFCAVRPPGHHAGYRGRVGCPNAPQGSNGFCIFNNVAIGAAYALDVYRHSGIKKVAILDFDVHHGNGTEQCVMNTVEHRDTQRYHMDDSNEIVRIEKVWHPWLGNDDRQNILFASVQGYGRQGRMDDYSGSWFYPGSGRTRDNADVIENETKLPPEIDFDEGQGFPRIISVGIGGPGDQSDLWKRSWRDKILPAVVDFHPDLIFLSAGFDAHKRDDINGGFVGLECCHYEWLTTKLTEVANKCCNGRIVSVLEGGYAIQGGAASAFASSVATHVSALNANSYRHWDPIDGDIEMERETHRHQRSRKRLRPNGGPRDHSMQQNQQGDIDLQNTIKDADGDGQQGKEEQAMIDTEHQMELDDIGPEEAMGKEAAEMHQQLEQPKSETDRQGEIDKDEVKDNEQQAFGRSKRKRSQVDYAAMDLEWRKEEQEKNEDSK